MTDFPMYKKYSIYDVNGDIVSKETFELIEKLKKQLELKDKIIEVLEESNNFYADKNNWFETMVEEAVIVNEDLGGLKAREAKTKIKKLREGEE